MTRSRSELLTPGEIEMHHIWSRCVQRAMLCGLDSLTGHDYSHRRIVLRDLVRYQSEVFAVDVGNYSIMGNHFHLIVRSRPDLVRGWSDEECAWRYRMAWPGYRDGQWTREPTDEQVEEVLARPQKLARAREYLSSISGMLARIKEPVARLFNAEMETKGHYWEARFGNRRLETPEETVGCSLYVDLNHVKAGVADSLVESDASAIQDRILSNEMRLLWAEQNAARSREAITARVGSAQGQDDEATLVDFFRDGWLAPITVDAPLAAEGEPFLVEAGEEDSPERAEDDEVNPKAVLNTKAATKRKQAKSRALHKRYRARLKRRKSDRCFIDSAFAVYRETADRLAEALLHKRSRRPRSSASKSSRSFRETASSFRREVASFLQSISHRIADLCSGESDNPARAGPRKPR